MPQFEGPFIYQDPHQAERPPPFIPHMHPHMPPHDPSEERNKEPKDRKPKHGSKGSKYPKPEIHQFKPHKSEQKHERVPSESDWDYSSEYSDSSQADTDRTPDTSYDSSNSSRKDNKDYYKGKGGRRDSHNHHDGRHEQVYRIHRRKPTVSPDRSLPSGRPRHEIEEIELVPATHMRNARPYLTRYRTAAHRPDRLTEQSDRPTFHTRHMSYDEGRHHSPRGLTPPGRRGSVHAPRRTTTLDLYDALEQQERLEKEEIKRELLREKYRKEDLRESVARELKREAEEMRRPLARHRGISSDVLYDERPGRSAAIMGRQFFVGGNFKMNGTIKSIQDIIHQLNDAKLDPNTEVVIAPPALYILLAREHLRKGIEVAAQNVFDKPNGAFTGEISAEQLKDSGITWTLTGHSERRVIMGEQDSFIASKTQAALNGGLGVILCVGETLEQREGNKTIDVVTTQLKAVAERTKDWSKIVVAYEPVWAIGTGKVATTEQAQEVHAEIRKWLSSTISQEASDKTRIIYGGSVSEKNCKDLAKQSDIDGFLVGGASLKPAFVDIINARS
ncbi:MAG: hypothetical protein LQ341_002687 [Variospora aurantia]|nr:MAG: hypothetical protein LQ341_002687 [Variospora aurantia]